MHCLYNYCNILVQAEVADLDYERSHFVIMFYHLHNICVRPEVAPLDKNIIIRQARDDPLSRKPQKVEDPSATGLLLRTFSAGPVVSDLLSPLI